MVGRYPNPPFRLLRVPGFSRNNAKVYESNPQKIMEVTWAAKHSWISASQRQGVREPPQRGAHCHEAQPIET